jgi:Ras family protein T1
LLTASPAEGVGKSTIVTSLIKESFVAHVSQTDLFCLPELSTLDWQVQHIVPEVTIPPEVTPEKVTTYIVDSGSRSTVSSVSVGAEHSLYPR